jgi:dipeptidyl-peptidase-3
MKRIFLAISCALVGMTIFAQLPQNPARADDKGEPSTLVDRVGSTGYMQLEAESFKRLTLKQQALAYWLTQASIAINPIIYDQQSRFGLRQKHILEEIVAHSQGIKPEVMKKIVDYTKLFWSNHGNHNDTTAQKFLPEFTFEELTEAGLQAIKNGASLGSAEAFRKEMAELKQSFFDADFEPLVTAKSPRGNLDIIQASSNNYYANVTLEDLKNFSEHYPLNSRVVKLADGKIVEEVYRAGTPDGRVPPGRYANYLQKAIGYLEKARVYAEPGQDKVIDDLIKFYQTGEFPDWLQYGGDWVLNNTSVDFINGFIEVYLDARGAKGTSQSFVSITDEKVSNLMKAVGDNAQYFEDHAPWLDQYKKQGVKPPVAKAVEAVIETGDFTVSTIGDNLPNENEIHQKYGSKSFLFTGSTRAFSRATGTSSLEEFAASPEELEICKKYGDEAEDLLTALHEIVGHGSGKLSPKLTHDYAFYLREYASTLEEARADLMGLWNVTDPKLKELGLVSNPDVAKAMYYGAARAPLTQLRSILKGDTIEEDHQRDRALIANYIMDKTGAIAIVKRNGKTYVEIRDFEKMHQGVGMLLAELMRIKAEGDYDAIKALVDKYGSHFDPSLRDEVVARFNKLNLPTYFTGVNPELTPSFRQNGEITHVEISYPRNFMHQQLGYSSMYDPDLLNDTK